MLDKYDKQTLRQALQDYRRQALTHFIQELISVMEEEGYSFQDLIEALANYSDLAKLSDVTRHLELASALLERLHHDGIQQ